MTEASIPIDPTNPGHVLASMGFLEAANRLVGNSEGGFTWDSGGVTRFRLDAETDRNPFHIIVEFLKKEDVTVHSGPWDDVQMGPEIQATIAPCRIGVKGIEEPFLEVGHWSDETIMDKTRRSNNLKQFAGGQKGSALLANLLESVKSLVGTLDAAPFDAVCPLSGSFKLDARGAWTDREAGYSLYQQDHEQMCSPLVELLAAVGLEHMRPAVEQNQELRYTVWKGLLPPILARAAFGGAALGLETRSFRFVRNQNKYYKQVTVAQELQQ